MDSSNKANKKYQVFVIKSINIVVNRAKIS